MSVERGRKARVRRYKDYVEYLKRSRDLNVKTVKVIKSIKGDLNKASNSILWNERNGVEDKLVKAGVTLAVAVPEPILSNAVGATMMALGATIGRNEKKRIHMKFKEILEELKRACREMNSLRLFSE